MGGNGRSGRGTTIGAVDRALRSPLYLVGGLLSGTVVTTGSEVLSTILLSWIRRETGLLPSAPDPTPTPTTVTPTGNGSSMVLSHYVSGPAILVWVILLVALAFIIALGLRTLGRQLSDNAAEEPRSTAPEDGDRATPFDPDSAESVGAGDTDADTEAPPSVPSEHKDDRGRKFPETSMPTETPEPQSRSSRALAWLADLRGLLWGSIGGAVVGLALGAVYLPTVAVQVAIALSVAGAAVGDVVRT